MNRRQLLAASTLALVGCGPQEKNEDQTYNFKIDRLSLPEEKREHSKQEVFCEAQIAAILLTVLHPSALRSISASATPSGELKDADAKVYTKVRDYIATHPKTIEPAIRAFQTAIATLTMHAAGSSVNSYTGDPEACLAKGNLAIVQGLFKVTPS
jgi:hypothetical protein